MAKRMTETEKWKNPWFRKLHPRLKCLWSYILDSCDCAGIWKEDFELASFQIGDSVTREDFDRAFEGRFVRLDSETVFIRPFVEFQYGKLKPGSKPHEAVVARLMKYGVELRPYLASPCQPALPEPFPNPLDTLPEPDPNGSRTLKDKEKEKEKDKVQETEKAQAKEKEQGTARASLVSGPDLDFDFAAPELVGHVIERELGLEAPPVNRPAYLPAPPVPDNVRVGPWSGSRVEPVSAPPRAPDPPRPAPAARTPALPKPLPPRQQYAPAPPCRPLPQDGIDAGPEARRLFRDLWGAGYRPPRADQPVTRDHQEDSA